VKESEWVALCGALGLPHLADDARFAVADLRGENREALEAILEPRFRQKTQLTWANACNDAGVPSEIPIDTKAGDLVLFDADSERLGLVAEYEHPIMGTLRQFGDLIQFSDAPSTIDTPPPRVGENTREILEWLGYDEPQIDKLKADNIVNWPEAEYPWII
jgi:crotonobetainyl-CoA:carnitine CoA-transferase CaiB-like acyl-CoA transferase